MRWSIIWEAESALPEREVLVRVRALLAGRVRELLFRCGLALFRRWATALFFRGTDRPLKVMGMLPAALTFVEPRRRS
jgi:hypothetical protein